MKADERVESVLAEMRNFGPVTDAQRFAWANRIALAHAREAQDAGRWRALIGSARVRVLGSAGLHSELDPYGMPWNGYAHIGLELWTKHARDAANEPADAVELVTKYAAIAARQQGEAHEA